MSILKRALTVFAIAVLPVTAGVTVSAPAYAADTPTDNPGVEYNFNTIDWTTVDRYSKDGFVIPMREGQKDYQVEQGPLMDGFGRVHIQQGHGVVPDHEVIQEALDGTCVENGRGAGRWTCTSDEIEVGLNQLPDERSGDNEAFGIITVFFPNPYEPCGC